MVDEDDGANNGPKPPLPPKPGLVYDTDDDDDENGDVVNATGGCAGEPKAVFVVVVAAGA